MDTKQPDPAACLHRLRRLPASAKPYRYRCEVCGQHMKILNGVSLDRLEQHLARALRKGRPRAR